MARLSKPQKGSGNPDDDWKVHRVIDHSVFSTIVVMINGHGSTRVLENRPPHGQSREIWDHMGEQDRARKDRWLAYRQMHLDRAEALIDTLRQRARSRGGVLTLQDLMRGQRLQMFDLAKEVPREPTRRRQPVDPMDDGEGEFVRLATDGVANPKHWTEGGEA